MVAANDIYLPELLTTAEAAQQLRLSTATLERLRVTGGGPVFTKLGPGKRARVVYQRSELDAWISANRRETTSA